MRTGVGLVHRLDLARGVHEQADLLAHDWVFDLILDRLDVLLQGTNLLHKRARKHPLEETAAAKRLRKEEVKQAIYPEVKFIK